VRGRERNRDSVNFRFTQKVVEALAPSAYFWFGVCYKRRYNAFEQVTRMPVQLPLDHLHDLWPKELRGARIGALLHPTSVSSKLEHASQILEKLSGELFQLRAFFGPQHGFLGQTQDNMIEWKSYEHPRLRIPVYSLYGEHREPTPEMLDDVEALIVDLQDVGARYYTFIWTLYLCMRACEKRGATVVVLDRPNPINGITVADRERLRIVRRHASDPDPPRPHHRRTRHPVS